MRIKWNWHQKRKAAVCLSVLLFVLAILPLEGTLGEERQLQTEQETETIDAEASEMERGDVDEEETPEPDITGDDIADSKVSSDSEQAGNDESGSDTGGEPGGEAESAQAASGITPYSTGHYIVTNDNTAAVLDTVTSLEDAVAACLANVPCTITATMDDPDLQKCINITSNKRITLTSAGADNCTITRVKAATDSGLTDLARHFRVLQGSLTLENITLAGEGLTTGGIGNGGLILNDSTAALNIGEGAVITGCYNQRGSVSASRGTIRMTGGIITENTAILGGGGVYLSSTGEFDMADGEISKNSCTSGGGVYLDGNNTRMTMTGGAITEHTDGGTGGGVTINRGIFELDGGTISKNAVRGSGGGVYVGGDNSNNYIAIFKMKSGEICENVSNGAVIIVNGGGGIMSAGSLEITGGIIRDNKALGGRGGGIHTSGISGSASITNCFIQDNEAAEGGGWFMTESDVVMTDTAVITRNKADLGGGIMSGSYCVFDMEGGEISNNEAASNGGGIYLRDGATINVTGASVITANRAVNGGGVYFYRIGVGGTFAMQDSSITSNQATGDGGGIYDSLYSYSNPADTSSYTNLSINAGSTVSSNTAGNRYHPPRNHADFTKFSGLLLDNDNINYKGPYYLTYRANNGTSEVDQYQNASGGSGTVSVNLLGNEGSSGTGFSAPPGDMIFAGWNTAADGSGISYDPGVQISVSDSSQVLYAQWIARPAAYTVTVRYYYFEEDGTVKEWDTAMYTEQVSDGTITIDTSASRIPDGYIAWYYTADHDSETYYFADDGDTYDGVTDDITIYVYAKSTIIDVTIPANNFFWYTNENSQIDTWIYPDGTLVNGADHAYQIKSARYTITNNSPTDLVVSLDSYEQAGAGKRGEIERLMSVPANAGDELVLNLTGDLAADSTADQPLGQDIFKEDSGSVPFGTYKGLLKRGSANSWDYAFSGYYYPKNTQSLPVDSVTSDYIMALTFALDLSGPGQ